MVPDFVVPDFVIPELAPRIGTSFQNDPASLRDSASAAISALEVRGGGGARATTF